MPTMCETCKVKSASFALPSEPKKRRWCRPCSDSHKGAFDISNQKCEDCIKGIGEGDPTNPKAATHGMHSTDRNQRKKRWCGICARAHPGAVDIHSKKCEDCKQKGATQGLACERKRRWCAACAKSHPEAIDITNKRCEDCAKAEARFGLAAEGKKRWCQPCGEKHPGATNLKKTLKCEDCKLKDPNYGQPAKIDNPVPLAGKRRWCSGCSKAHAGAYNLYAHGLPSSAAAEKRLAQAATAVARAQGELSLEREKARERAKLMKAAEQRGLAQAKQIAELEKKLAKAGRSMEKAQGVLQQTQDKQKEKQEKQKARALAQKQKITVAKRKGSAKKKKTPAKKKPGVQLDVGDAFPTASIQRKSPVVPAKKRRTGR